MLPFEVRRSVPVLFNCPAHNRTAVRISVILIHDKGHIRLICCNCSPDDAFHMDAAGPQSFCLDSRNAQYRNHPSVILAFERHGFQVMENVLDPFFCCQVPLKTKNRDTLEIIDNQQNAP